MAASGGLAHATSPWRPCLARPHDAAHDAHEVGRLCQEPVQLLPFRDRGRVASRVHAKWRC